MAFTILTFANFLLAMSGTLLNWVVVKTVFQFGSLIGNSQGLLIAWGILRDIGNLLLLFGFIFMGLLTILDAQKYETRKAIPRLIMFAVLMNFSLFAAEAVIDVSNGLSSTLYAQANSDPCTGILGGDAGAQAGGQTQVDCAVNYGIAGHIMQSTGLSTMWKVNNDNGLAPETFALLGLALFATIGAVVMFAAAIMLIVRVVVLSFLMIAAPIGFAGMAIPQLEGYAKDWWSRLIHQSFFAPVLFLLIFISLKITDTFTAGTADRSLAGAVTQPGASVMGVIMVFAIVIGFLIASLIAARNVGAHGASFAVNAATRFVYGGVTRGTNFAIGGGASGLRYLQQTKYGQKIPGGKALNKRILTPLAGANLDMRRLPGIGGALGRAGAGDAAKPSEHATFADMKHQYQDFRDNKEGQKREKEYQDRVKAQQLESEAHDGTLSNESQQYLSQLSEKQLMELHGIKEGLGVLAQNLTPEQFDKLMNNKELDDGAKSKLRDGRYGKLQQIIDDAAANPGDAVKQAAARDAVKALTNKDLGHLGAAGAPKQNLIRNDLFTSMLSDDQYKEMRKNTNLTQPEQVEFEASRNRNNAPAKVASRLGTMTRENIGNLGGDVVSDPMVLNAMSAEQLAAINPDKLNPSQLAAVTNYIKLEMRNNTQKGDRFRALANGNPQINQRWAGRV